MDTVYAVARIALTLWLLLPACVAVAATGDDADAKFSQGVQAFRAGEYAQALEAFEAARRLGLDSWRLRYNLAVTCYHLQRYPQARQGFETLLDTPGIADRARYNLGLVSLRQGRDDEAFGHFLRVAEAAGDPGLRQLAETQLAAFVPVTPASRAGGFIDAGAGYDDNVALVPDSAVNVQSGQGDTFTEVMGGLIGHLTGTPDSGVRLKASAYWINYTDLDAFDQLSLRGGLAWRERIGRWRSELAGYVDLVYLDTDPFERIGTVSLQGVYDAGAYAELRLRARSGYIDAAGDYSALTGWRNQLLGEVRIDRVTRTWRLGYEYENNERDGYDNGVQTASVSPQQHKLFAGVDWRVSEDTLISLAGDYCYSRYDDPAGGRSQGGGSAQRREDRGWQAVAGVDYDLTNVWTVSGEFRIVRNDSNLDEYDYTSRRFMVRLERLF